MELFTHQKTGIEFLKEPNPSGVYRRILGDEMGLGKTRQAIMAARESGARGVLIVCPASLKINWKREINSVYPEDFSEAAQDSGHMNEVMIIDSKSDLPAPSVPEWYVINYDILEKKRDLIDFLIDHKIVDTLILDEAHYIKGKSIRATTVVGGALKGTRLPGMANRVSRLYCLTGTPLLNRPIELFNLLRAIKHPLGSNRQKFATRYCNAFYMVMVRDNLTGRQFLVQSVENAYKYYGDRSRYTHLYRFLNESGSSHLDELREQMKGYILRRTKKEVMDLPEKIVSTIENELTPDQKKIYDRAWEDYLAVIKEGDPDPEKLDNIMLARHLVEIQKLKQICSRAKVALISADIRNAVEQGEKVIVFSQYTETIRQLKDELSKEPKGSEAIKSVTLTGENNQDERQRAIDAFQNDPETKVFIANMKAGGVGLTLTAASQVIFADMAWSPEEHAQAEDRAHRIGQEGTVNVYYYIMTGTIEEDIVEILNSKKGIMNEVLSGTRKTAKTGGQAAFLKLLAKKAQQ